jgi:hypothetical protein
MNAALRGGALGCAEQMAKIAFNNKGKYLCNCYLTGKQEWSNLLEQWEEVIRFRVGGVL